MSPVKFYVDAFWFSPYSFSVFVALNEKEIPYEVVEVALHKRENKTLEYRRASATGRIPAIQHEDFFLAESSAIVEYLDEAFASSDTIRLLPAPLQERAKARMIMAWIRSSRDLLPLIKERGTETMFYAKATLPLSESARQSAEKLLEVANFLIPEGQDALFSSWCIADSDLAFLLHRLLLNDYAIPAKLKRYAELHWQRPSTRKFVERSRPEFVPY
jgi:glutathione S-transferase